jgi:putative solute:sodium symporter small subunit
MVPPCRALGYFVTACPRSWVRLWRGSLNHQDYWKANIRLMLVLLAIWFTVSFGFGILLVDQLNQIPFFGFKFGFWWAQQGSIYVFIGLIFYYTYKMKKIDRQFGVSDDDDEDDA